MNTEKVLADFKRDTESHKANILLNSGLYRHIRFDRNGSSSYHFNLTTWPGYLAITGDMGDYIFSRTNDMFCFFRMDDNDFNKREDRELSINPSYWSEKVKSDSKYAGVKKFSIETFEARAKDRLKSALDEFPDDLAVKIVDEIADDSSWPTDESEMWPFLRDFDFDDISFSEEIEDAMADADLSFPSEPFVDWEHDCNEYTHHFIWCLYAIVWGINEFDRIVGEA